MKSIPLLSLALAAVAAAQEAPAEAPAPEPEAVDLGFIRVPNPAFPSPEVHEVPLNRGRKLEHADLVPYFSEGVRAQARAAFEAGKWAEVRALLEKEGGEAPVTYLRALAAMRQQDWAFASKQLEALAPTWPGMRDRCLVLAGQSFEELKDWASAQRVYEQVAAGTRQAFDAAMGLSRALRNTRQGSKAKDVLTPFAAKGPPPWGRDTGAEALLALADLAAARKDAKAEKEALLKLWSLHPMSIPARKADDRVAALGEPGNEAVVSRADALIDAHRNADGIAMLEPIVGALKLPDALACRAAFALGKGLRKQRAHSKAVQVLAPVVKKCTDPDLKARARYTLAFSRSVFDPAGAAVEYEALAREAPEHPFADDGLFYAADMKFRLNDTAAAMKLLTQLVERYPNGDWAAEALFREAWIHRTAKQLPDARAALEAIEQKFAATDDTYEVERARYWRARTFEAEGDAAKAAELLASVAVDHPATYYGLVARERLMKLDSKRAVELAPQIAAAAKADDVFPLYAGPLTDEPAFATAIEQLRLGFSDQVPLELLSIDRSGLSVDALRLMVFLIAQAGEERAAHGMARLWLRRDLSGRITTQSRAVWEIAYPNAFRELVVKNCEAAKKLDPDLLQALMREESALDPRALSWAGALGLTQLMPTTAWEVAAMLKIKRPTQAQLLDPDLNIRIGAAYLAGLVGQFKGVKQHAVASYNAGPGAVNRWRKEQPNAEVDEWVENIPLTETRGYVKRVLRSYNTYKLLYGSPEAVTAPLTGAL